MYIITNASKCVMRYMHVAKNYGRSESSSFGAVQLVAHAGNVVYILYCTK